MSVPGKREARGLDAQHAGTDTEGPGHLKPDPDAREQQGHADKVGDGLRGTPNAPATMAGGAMTLSTMAKMCWRAASKDEPKGGWDSRP